MNAACATGLQPSRTTVMIKPVGALCNLDCTYCYYLPTQALWDGHERRMSEVMLENIFAGLLPRFDDQVTIAWQGGEPTLAGLAFFEKAIELQHRYARPGQQITHALQTNGTLLDEAWCRFFRREQVLVGLSLDGPPRFHDHYRKDRRGQASSDAVLRGIDMLNQHEVAYNLLCVLNAFNVGHPDEVLGYLLHRGSPWLQFIPAIEWEQGENNQPRLASYAPPPDAYGQFLCRVFDRWFEQHRHRVSIRLFDAVLNQLVFGQTPLCIFDRDCHTQLTIEHDGSVFGCDHFVQPRWQLAKVGDPGWLNRLPHTGALDAAASAAVPLSVEGRVLSTSADGVDDSAWLDRLETDRFAAFAQRKQALPEQCERCRWRRFCYGGCPKHRPHGGDLPEPTILCSGYQRFFEHAMPRLEWLAEHFRRGVTPPPPGPRHMPPRLASARGRRVGRNSLCPCGSGKKFKRCCGG